MSYLKFILQLDIKKPLSARKGVKEKSSKKTKMKSLIPTTPSALLKKAKLYSISKPSAGKLEQSRSTSELGKIKGNFI